MIPCILIFLAAGQNNTNPLTDNGVWSGNAGNWLHADLFARNVVHIPDLFTYLLVSGLIYQPSGPAILCEPDYSKTLKIFLEKLLPIYLEEQNFLNRALFSEA